MAAQLTLNNFRVMLPGFTKITPHFKNFQGLDIAKKLDAASIIPLPKRLIIQVKLNDQLHKSRNLGLILNHM